MLTSKAYVLFAHFRSTSIHLTRVSLPHSVFLSRSLFCFPALVPFPNVFFSDCQRVSMHEEQYMYSTILVLSICQCMRPKEGICEKIDGGKIAYEPERFHFSSCLLFSLLFCIFGYALLFLSHCSVRFCSRIVREGTESPWDSDKFSGRKNTFMTLYCLRECLHFCTIEPA